MTVEVIPIKLTYRDYLTWPDDGRRYELYEGNVSPQGYQVLGRYSGDEVVSSQVLDGFQFVTKEIFGDG